MKTGVTKLLALLMLVAISFGACKDRNAEKRIAELEAELQKAKGEKKPEALSPGAVAAQPEVKPDGPLPSFQFETTKHDFGAIKEGSINEYTYSFKNNGAAPLVISDVRPTCGCTVPDFSKTPVPIGGTGYVKIKFDSNGKQGMVNKAVTVIANTYPAETMLNFSANISPKDASKK